MEIKDLLKKPLFQLTTEEFVFINKNSQVTKSVQNEKVEKPKNHVYGIQGIADLFGCSKATANRLKKSRVIDAAITQIGRKIIVDAELALKLVEKKNDGRE